MERIISWILYLIIICHNVISFQRRSYLVPTHLVQTYFVYQPYNFSLMINQMKLDSIVHTIMYRWRCYLVQTHVVPTNFSTNACSLITLKLLASS